MKGKVILFSLAVLLMLFAFTPLMASSASACLIVPASVIPIGPPTMTVTSVTSLPSGFVITKGDFSIPNLLVIGTGAHAKSYDTINTSTFTAVFDPYTDVCTITFDGSWQVILSTTNGFRYYPWSFVLTYYGYVSPSEYSYATVQVVAQGFGIFAGQTLVMHYAGTNSFTPWSGFVIIP